MDAVREERKKRGRVACAPTEKRGELGKLYRPDCDEVVVRKRKSRKNMGRGQQNNMQDDIE